MNATILTAYLTNSIDRQLNKQHKSNDISYVNLLMNSCNATKTPCVILVDFDCNLDGGEYVKFIKFDHYPDMTPHLRRFQLYQKFVEESNYDYYITCDCHDVKILRNPFTHIPMDDSTMYVGREEDTKTMSASAWVQFWFPKTTVPWVHYQQHPLLNCGIIGGSKNLLNEFLNNYITMMNIVKTKITRPAVIDMFSFNKVVYEQYNDHVMTGSPLHTKFKKYDYKNTVACIAHK